MWLQKTLVTAGTITITTTTFEKNFRLLVNQVIRLHRTKFLATTLWHYCWPTFLLNFLFLHTHTFVLLARKLKQETRSFKLNFVVLCRAQLLYSHCTAVQQRQQQHICWSRVFFTVFFCVCLFWFFAVTILIKLFQSFVLKTRSKQCTILVYVCVERYIENCRKCCFHFLI